MIGITGRAKGWVEPSTDWSLLEMSTIVEVGRSLELRGVRVEFDCGVTDEGDPWLVFCDLDTSELLCHVARLGSTYVACTPFGDSGTTGAALADVLEDFFTNWQSKIAPPNLVLSAPYKKI